MFPNIAFVPCSTKMTFVPYSPGINVISPVSQNPWEGLHYVDVIFSHMLTTYRIETKPIDGRSANKRMVGRKLEMSTRSGSNYLTLAGKSRFWYQIAPGALRPGFMPILVLQSP